MNVCKTSQSCISPILLILTIQYSFGIVFRNTPQDLDGLRDNSSVIVAGSVIQLFCSASGQFNAPRIQWTRNNVTIPETAQLPHLMIKSRTENLLTTSTFVIAGFLGADNGSYGCLARETGTASLIASPQLLLTATESSGAIKIIRELSIGNSANLSGLYSDDRTYVALGSDASSGSFLRCSAEQPGPSSLGAPSMVWLKDGTQLFGDGVRVVINTNTSIAGSSNRTVSFARIFNFSQSDAGVYQCVFYDTPSQGGEVITTRPYKVDTGPISLRMTSSPLITLCPPDPLVIQVEASGEYYGIQWIRAPKVLNNISDKLVDFSQTLVLTTTSVNDSGHYIVNLAVSNSSFSNASINFSVTIGTASPPSTTITPNGMVAIQPGTSIDITCTSSGYPPPALTWYYNNGPLLPSVAIGQPTQVNNGVCSIWRLTSVLSISNASSNAHQGVYTCAGNNTINGTTAQSNASLNIVVLTSVHETPTAVISNSSQPISSDFLLNITVIISVISAVVIVLLAMGLIALVVLHKKKNYTSTKESFNKDGGTEMVPKDGDIVPKPQEPPAYSRLFQDTPFYRPRRIHNNGFTTQSVPALVVEDHRDLRESKSSASVCVTSLPQGYEKPVSSTESVGNSAAPTHPQHLVHDLSHNSVELAYTDNKQEDFITVDELVEMTHKRQRGGTNRHHYVDQGASPSTKQLLSSISVLDTDS